MMTIYGHALDNKWQIPQYLMIRDACRGDFEDLAEKLFSTSVFTDKLRFTRFIDDFDSRSVKKLKKDVFYILSNGAAEMTGCRIRPELNR